MGKENKKYKNSMFVDLFFEDETANENDIALYNALHEEALPPNTLIQKIRIDDVLYMNFKNDISFDVNEKLLIFGEHQSTINENMPLRSLMYIGRAYEQIVPVRDRYKKRLVRMININPKKQHEILEKCAVLREYGIFTGFQK